MGVNKVEFGDETLIDLTQDTVNPSALAKGYTAHAANGEPIEGEFEEVDPTVPQWAKSPSKPSYNASEVGALATSGGIVNGLTQFKAGLVVSGRVHNSGDDEGIVVEYASNGLAGITLGIYNGKRTVIYGNNNGTSLWRLNDGTRDYDIIHPKKGGTIALISDIPTIPSSLPANGGNADYAKWIQTWKVNGTETYGSSYPLYAKWQSNNHLRLKCDPNYIVEVNYADSSESANYANKVWTQSHQNDWYMNSNWDGTYFQTNCRDKNGNILGINVERANSTGNADLAGKLGNGSTCSMYFNNTNEVNFGGSATDSWIFFGYRATDSRPKPTTYVFGSDNGSAIVKALEFYENDTALSNKYASISHTHSYLPLSGGTLTGVVNIGDVSHSRIMLRTSDTWKGGIGWDIQGNECLSLWAKNSATRLRWNAGIDMSNMANGTMYNIIPDFEISKADGSAKGYIGGTRIATISDIPSSLPANGGTANRSYGLKDSNNSYDITVSYSKAGLDSTSWLAAWNGYELRAIAPGNIIAGKADQVKNAAGGYNPGITTSPNNNWGIEYIQKMADSDNLSCRVIGTWAVFYVSLWSSDRRLKENIVENNESALDKLNQLQTYSFDFKNSGYGKHTNMGIIAQDLDEVIPEAVMHVKQGDDAEYDELLQIDGNKLIPYLIKSVQELSDICKKQQEEIDELKKLLNSKEVIQNGFY